MGNIGDFVAHLLFIQAYAQMVKRFFPTKKLGRMVSILGRYVEVRILLGLQRI